MNFSLSDSDLYMYNEPYNQCPRNCLKKQILDAESMGYSMKSGVERKKERIYR